MTGVVEAAADATGHVFNFPPFIALDFVDFHLKQPSC